ncbi:hypothetical protein EDD11_007458 [Mortierella claussenii]|nr:hypothetical protein EDD11_007458 [Mortierella claussenii]
MMDRNETPDTSATSPATRSPRHIAQRTPRTPASAPASIPASASAHASGIKGISASVTPSPAKNKVTGKPGGTSSLSGSSTPTDSTTPAYPESIVLAASSKSTAKLQLSDMQPIDTKTLERIKSLEISLQQHKDSEEQFRKRIQAARHDLVTSKEHHEHTMQVKTQTLRNLKRALDKLQHQSLHNSGRLQELWDMTRTFNDNLTKKENAIMEHKQRFAELKRYRDEILKEKQETEAEELEKIRAEKRALERELDECMEMIIDFQNCLVAMDNTFTADQVQALKDRAREQDERSAQLEAMIAEARSEMSEKTAEDLISLFEDIYERRIRAVTEELQEALRHAEKMERKRDQEANVAMEEYLKMNQLSVEAEEKASREEFKLLTKKEELAELNSTLQALKDQIHQIGHPPTVKI